MSPPSVPPKGEGGGPETEIIRDEGDFFWGLASYLWLSFASGRLSDPDGGPDPAASLDHSQFGNHPPGDLLRRSRVFTPSEGRSASGNRCYPVCTSAPRGEREVKGLRKRRKARSELVPLMKNPVHS